MNHHVGWLTCAAVAALISSTPALASDLDSQIRFDIAAQPLDGALLTFSRQTGLQVISSSTMVANRRGGAVVGMKPARAGLAEMLAGTGLSFTVTGADTVTIVPEAPALAASSTAGAVSTPAPVRPISIPREEIRTLEEVVVTATREISTANKVPMTVSALTQRAMDVRGITTVSDLARTLPGMTFRTTSPEINPIITIRGIGGYGAVVGAATTGVYLDDSPLTQRNLNGARTGNGTPFPQLFDLDRVEVLRGPQGTLYGASSEGGTIRFITPTPSLTTASGLARAEISSTDQGAPSHEAGFALGGPIVADKLGFRVSAVDRRNGGWIDALSVYDGHRYASDVNYRDIAAFRGALKWQIDPSFSVSAALYVGRDYSNQPDTFWKATPKIDYVGSTIYNGAPAPELGAAYAAGACTVLTAVAPNPGPCRTASGAYFAFPNTVMPAFSQAATPWYTGASIGAGRYLTASNVQFVASPRTATLLLPSLTVDKDFGAVSVKSITSYIANATKGMTAGVNGPGMTRILSRFMVGPTACDPTGLMNIPRGPNGRAAAGGRCYTPSLYLPGFTDYEDEFHYVQKREAKSEEIRLSSARGGRLTWIAGLYYSESNIRVHGLENSNEDAYGEIYRGAPEAWFAGDYGLPAGALTGNPLSPPAALSDVSDREGWLLEREYALFGEANFKVSPKLTLTAGLRLSDYNQNFRQVYGGLVAGNPPPGSSIYNPSGFTPSAAALQSASRDPTLPNSAANPIVNPSVLAPFATNLAGCPTASDCPQQFTYLSDHERTVAPKIGFTYQINATDLIYATFAKGYRPGGVNPPLPQIQCAADLVTLGLAKTPQTYNQDSVNSYEIGSKLRVLGGRLQLNSSVFLIDWSNMQINQTLSCGFGLIINAAHAQSKGAELQATGRFGAWTFNANVGYDDAAFSQEVRNSSSALIQNKGDNIGVPDWTLALDGQYDFRILDQPGFVRLDYSYSGRYMRGPGPGTTGYNTLTNSGQATQLWNARLGLALRGVDWSLFAYNLTNTQAFINQTGGAQVTADSGQVTGTSFRPRTVGLQANYRF